MSDYTLYFTRSRGESVDVRLTGAPQPLRRHMEEDKEEEEEEKERGRGEGGGERVEEEEEGRRRMTMRRRKRGRWRKERLNRYWTIRATFNGALSLKLWDFFFSPSVMQESDGTV